MFREWNLSARASDIMARRCVLKPHEHVSNVTFEMKIADQAVVTAIDPTDRCTGTEVTPEANWRFDLLSFSTVQELESLGAEKLKIALSQSGLKCGGTTWQRAQRLFLLKSTPLDQMKKKLLSQ